jgi:hypothetical protein
MNPGARQQSSSIRRSWPAFLARSPQVITAPNKRSAVTTLIIIGAVLTVISGVIHLYLWGEANGYRQIPTIGPLFLAQGVCAVLIGLAAAATRRLAVVVAAAGLLASTAVGLVITIEVGLFGFRESWGAPYVRASLYEEIAGTVVLLIAAWPLARAHAGPAQPR